jgi:hypothetical protein
VAAQNKGLDVEAEAEYVRPPVNTIYRMSGTSGYRLCASR